MKYFALLIVLLALEPTALGSDYHIRGMGGVYRSSETSKDIVDGDNKNDAEAAIGSLSVDVSRWGPMQNQFTLEIRDRYDSFGNQDRQVPRLVPSTEPEVRQLALKYPNTQGAVYWGVGRFPVLDAALIANDGVDVGIRRSTNLRIGAFGGLYPERRDGNSVLIAEEGAQQGVYLDYDDKSASRQKHIYLGSALTHRSPSQNAKLDPTTEQNDTASVAGNTSVNERQNSRTFSYNNLVFMPSDSLRLTSLSMIDLAPKARIKDLWITYYQKYNPKFSSTLSLTRIDPTEYEKIRDFRDTLGASIFTNGHLLIKQQLGKAPSIWYDLAYGVRSKDKLTRQQVGARLVFLRLGGGRMGAHVGAWSRKNYLSRDTILKLGANYVSDNYDLNIIQQVITENHTNGQISHPLITDISGGFYLTKSLMGTFGVEYAKDEKVTITSGLIGLGFRITSDQLTPGGLAPPPPESL